MNDAGVSTERRKHVRVKTCIPVRFTREGDESGAVGVGSLTSDVCEGGLRFTTSEFIAAPCRLILELDVPTQDEPIQAVSQVPGWPIWPRIAEDGTKSEISSWK